ILFMILLSYRAKSQLGGSFAFPFRKHIATIDLDGFAKFARFQPRLRKRKPICAAHTDILTLAVALQAQKASTRLRVCPPSRTAHHHPAMSRDSPTWPLTTKAVSFFIWLTPIFTRALGGSIFMGRKITPTLPPHF